MRAGGQRLEYLLIPIVFGVGSAAGALVAASDGAGDFARVRQLTRAGAGLGFGACGLVGATVALFPRGWMGLFTRDSKWLPFGVSYLTRVGPAKYFAPGWLSISLGKRAVVQPLLATTTPTSLRAASAL